MRVTTSQTRWLIFIFGLLARERWGENDGPALDVLDITQTPDRLNATQLEATLRELKIQPRLVRFDGIDPSISTSIFSSRLQTLCILQVELPHLGRLFRALSTAPSLRQLQIARASVLSSDTVFANLANFQALPKLEELELDVYVFDFPGLFFKHLTAPALRRLSLGAAKGMTPLSGTRETVKELYIWSWDTDEMGWSLILAALPGLEVLSLHACSTSSSELACLLYVPAVCPKLHALSFSDIYNIESSFIASVTQSRVSSSGVTAIATLIVTGCDSNVMDYDALQELEDEGTVDEVVLEPLDFGGVSDVVLEEEASTYGSDPDDTDYSSPG